MVDMSNAPDSGFPPNSSDAGSRRVSRAREESVRPASLSDQPTKEDSLGFTPYVEAIAEFLLNPATQAPLTLSIEGEWGSGKSSFMLQLKEELQKKEKGKARIVEFNAWRHDKDDSIWAAFALEFIRQLSTSLFPPRRWIAHARLTLSRFDWLKGWPKVVTAVTLWFVMLMAVMAGLTILWAEGSGWVAQLNLGELSSQVLKLVIGAGGLGAAVVSLALVCVQVAKLVGNPLAVDLSKFIESPDYEARIAFIEKFQADFERVVHAYSPKNRVFVFVDDLDRCEIPRAADLMQSLNLMMSAAPKLIFILGMDREKIAAALALKNKELIPYLSSGMTQDSTSGLEFGYGYMEKFVQLPFRIPQPRKEIRSLLMDGRKEQPAATPTQERRRQAITVTVSEDSETIVTMGEMVAPCLDLNPRRIKQFVNVFRLKAIIGAYTGLFDQGDEAHDALTFEQLAKFVAISLRWPLLLYDLDDHPDLLRTLERHATGTRSIGAAERGFRWTTREELMVLLRFGAAGKAPVSTGISLDRAARPMSIHPNFSFERVDITRLLQVSPKVTAPRSSTQQTDRKYRSDGRSGDLPPIETMEEESVESRVRKRVVPNA